MDVGGKKVKKLNRRKRTAVAFLALLVAVLAFGCVGCGEEQAVPDSSEGGTMGSVYPEKQDVIEDRQSWTGGEVRFPDFLWDVPAAERVPEYDRTDCGAEAYFLDSVTYQGQTTKVFALVGIPGEASAENPVPGAVLVHGGGGTAFADWVKYWTDRGYAAISIDTEGHIPTADASVYQANVTQPSPRHHGPANLQFSDSQLPIEEQWPFHAVAATIVANSFLRSFPSVQASKIGLTGISWGSVIAANAACYDDRFAFCVPVYGGLGLEGTTGICGDIYRNYPRGAELWDGLDKLEACRTPFLFLNGNADPYFTLDATSRCLKAAPNGEMLIIDKMIHGHLQGFDVPDIYAFADNICFGTEYALPQIIRQPSFESQSVAFDLSRSNSVVGMVYYTLDSEITPETLWLSQMVRAKDGEVVFEIHESTTAFYVTLTDYTYSDVGYRSTSELVMR